MAVGWLIAEKLLGITSATVVGVWVVRALGPEKLGQLSVATAIATVLASLASAGLESILLRALSARTHPTGEVLRAALRIRLVGAVSHIAACAVVAAALFPNDHRVQWLTLIVAASAALRVADVLGSWMQDKGEYARYSAMRVSARVTTDAYLLLLVFTDSGLYWFAAAPIVESGVLAGLMATQARRADWRHGDSGSALQSSFAAQAVPVAVSGLFAALYARVDQFLIYRMLGAESTGLYSAATRISEAFTMLAAAVGTVAATRFGRLAGADSATFRTNLLRYNRAMIGVGLLLSALVSMGAPSIVALLYGPRFAEAGQVLAVHAWTIWLVFASTALEPWFYQHAKLRLYVPKAVLSFCFSLPCTWLMTGHLGPAGTAAAVVATYTFSVFATNLILPGLRDVFALQMAVFGFDRKQIR